MGDRRFWQQSSVLARWLWAVGAILFLLGSQPFYGKLSITWQTVLVLSGFTLSCLGLQLHTLHLMVSTIDRVFRWTGFGLLVLLLTYSIYQLFAAYARV